MNEGGVNAPIISAVGPTDTTFAKAEHGALLAVKINNQLKAAASVYPRRLFPLAELPFHSPTLAIKELQRCAEDGFVGTMLSGSIKGTGKFLDGPEFTPLLAAFES